METKGKSHLRTFALAAIVAWVLGTCALIYFSPHMFYNALKRAVVKRGLGIKAGGIPVNTLFTIPVLASPLVSKSDLVRTATRFVRMAGLISAKDLISGPHWQGVVPEGVTKIVSPNNSALVIGRTLVEGDGDLPTAYNLAKQIQVVPLTTR